MPSKKRRRKRTLSNKTRNNETGVLEDNDGPSRARMCIKCIKLLVTLPCKILSMIMSWIVTFCVHIKEKIEKCWLWVFPSKSKHKYRIVGDAEDPIEMIVHREPNRKRFIELEIRLKENEETINTLTNERDDALSRLQEHESRRREIGYTVTRLSEENKNLKADKEDALSRLSELMGAKLRDNNPAITNLNDPNRPMKLGDQFSELYENEWTDSYTDLTESKELNLSEDDAIIILLNIVKEIYQVCLHDVAEQLSGQKRPVNGFSDDEIERFMKDVKDSVKSRAGIYVPLLCKKITNGMISCPTVTKYKSYSLEYIENCVKICYFAVVQDPPMYIDFKPDDVFDKQAYKEYTMSGTLVDYVVWPALYLHKGGPILCKGVVQPK